MTKRSSGRGRTAPAAPSGPTVTVVRTGDVQEVGFSDGMTIRQALSSADISVGDGQQVRLNNKACTDLDTALAEGDQVMLLGKIAGA